MPTENIYDIIYSPAFLSIGLESAVYADTLLLELTDVLLYGQLKRTLSASLLKVETKKSYARSQGVCLRHLEMLIEATSDEQTTKFLLQTASSVLQLISEDMEGFALKREAARRYLVSEDEEDAYLRAAIHLAGAKHICVPWTFRDEI